MLFCIHENFIVRPPIYFDNSTLKCRQSCYFQLNLRRKTDENLYLKNLIHVALAMDLLTVSLRNVTPLKNYIQCPSHTFLNMKGKRKNNIIYIPAFSICTGKTSQNSQIFYIQDRSGANLLIHFRRKTGSRLKMLCHKMHFQNSF